MGPTWGGILSTTMVKNPAQKRDAAGSQLDFAELFQQYYARVYTYLRYRVSTPEDAEDLISLVFEKAYTHREQFDGVKGAFSTWLFSIAHHTLANHYRTRQRHAHWESEDELPEDVIKPESSPEIQVIQQETLANVLAGLACLSERDQEVISLKFAGRLSNQEIGQIMNLSEKNVSVVLWRAMRRLREQLEEV
ncbi:MAG: RNA polymerase subunit sigma-24 [Anaerolineae bacterium]|nr:RNA polymerase subunit sigma-24 [Anaerolineae bacterium]